MPSKISHGLLISAAIIGLFFASVIGSYGQTVNYVYIYDDLNRLIRVVYDNGTVIKYTYDEVGNRSEEKIELDTTPPTGTIVINSGERLRCQVLKCESRAQKKICKVNNSARLSELEGGKKGIKRQRA